MNVMKTATVALTLFAAAAAAQAQAWPAKTITWVVPFTAGGPTDAMARDIGTRVAKEIGQTIVIENAAGAGGRAEVEKWRKVVADAKITVD